MIAFSGCKKGDSGSSSDGAYYISATVDGKVLQHTYRSSMLPATLAYPGPSGEGGGPFCICLDIGRIKTLKKSPTSNSLYLNFLLKKEFILYNYRLKESNNML
ncbi:MAG TPA: hypothetical protein VF421_18545 [Niabella sp.]